MVKQFKFDDREALFQQLTLDCQQHLRSALAETGRACLLVSGGSTPSPLYQALSLSDLDWRQIHVALVDERWVDRQHDASNEGLVYRTLLQNNAANAPFTGMKTNAATAREGQAETEKTYRALPQPFTVAILGMGSDGHTASLFPYAGGLSAALADGNDQLTAAITAQQSEVTGANTERLSLTLNGLLRSRRLIVLLTGEDKLAVFETAMAQGAMEAMPIRAILRQNSVPVELYWAP